jgi:5-(carboxyamino)imidazole ribonucleotide mutase
MPAGIPVATLAIGDSGATNAALFAAAILSGKYPQYREAIVRYRQKRAADVLSQPDPRTPAASPAAR